jgi:dual specificity MAP kinase phosphatase
MAHYQLSLVDAYLMVRARRLSVIIQPNLLFMYELLQWEQQLKGRFDPMGWPGVAREVHGLNMYYIGS